MKVSELAKQLLSIMLTDGDPDVYVDGYLADRVEVCHHESDTYVIIEFN